MSTASVLQRERPALAGGIIHLGFVLTGIVTTLLGPVLPILCARWALPDSRAGTFFTAQFAGSMLGVALTGVLVPRRGFRFSLGFGYLLMAMGIAVLALDARMFAWAAVFGYGMGQGVVIPASNLWISEQNPARREAALSILNFAWGIGAVGCPFLIALMQRQAGIWFWLFVLAGALVVVALSVGRMPVGPATTSRTKPGSRSVARLWRCRLTYVLGLLFFLYVGTETALGGWAAAYAKRMSPDQGTAWMMAPGFFWGALLLGRGLAPALLRALSARQLLVADLTVAATGVFVLLAAHSELMAIAGVAIAGLGCASVFPMLVGRLPEFGEDSSRIAGSMFALGSLGGAVLPWIVGLASTQFASLKLALVLPFVAVVVMLGLQGAGRHELRSAAKSIQSS